MSEELRAQEQNTVKATLTMPVSVTLNGNVKEPNDVTDRRNGLRNRCSNPPLPPFSKGGRGGLLLLALCFLLFFCPYAFADGPSAWLNVNYTDTKQYEDGKKTQTSDNLYQNYYLRLDKSITPVISYQLYLRSTLTNSHTTDSKGNTSNAYLRAIEPALDIYFRNPLYALDVGYRRLEQWTTANLSDKSRKTTDFYYSRFNITPYALPSLSLQLDRQKDYDHLSTRKIDTTDTKFSGSSWYDLIYKDVKLSYNLTYTHDEKKTPAAIITKTVSNNLNGLYNLGYTKSFWRGSVNVSAGYQGNYVRNKSEQFATQTGSVSFERIPSSGMYGLGTQLQPDVDTLITANALIDNIYNVPVTTTTGTINIGQNGSKFHNIGIQLFSSTKPVDAIYIYVSKDIMSDTNLINTANWKAYRSDFNLPATWTEVSIKSITPTIYDTLNNVYRYEIRFSSPQNGLYYRVINLDNASISDVLVTEIEAYGTDIIPQSGKITDTITFFTQGINLNANLRPISKLIFTLDYFLTRADQDPASIINSISGAFANIVSKSIKENGNKLTSNVTRTYGATTKWLTHRLLTTTVRFQRNEAFDNKDETDLKSDTYSLAFNSSPLPTLDTNLSFIRTYSYDFSKKHSMNDLYLLTIGAKLYRNVNMITDIGYTQSRTYAIDDPHITTTASEDTKSSTRYIRGTFDARLTANLSGNLTYGFSRTTGNTSSSSNDGTLIITYRPGKFINLSGSLKVLDTDNETTTSEGIFMDWLILPAIRTNVNYEHSNTEPDAATIDSFSGYLIWYVTRFLDFQFTYGYTRNVKEKKTETYNLGANLTCRFW
jgi:hypothetical protein